MTTQLGPFTAPASSSGINWADLQGALLLIKPREKEQVQTSFGEKEAIRADIFVVDAEPGDVQTTFEDALIFPRVLVSQVAPNVGTGRMTLGRLGKGVAKSGQQAPWRLEDPSEDDKALAMAWLKKNEPAPF